MDRTHTLHIKQAVIHGYAERGDFRQEEMGILAENSGGVKEIIVLPSIKKYHRYDKINFAVSKDN
jgi:hypothetical protein